MGGESDGAGKEDGLQEMKYTRWCDGDGGEMEVTGQRWCCWRWIQREGGFKTGQVGTGSSTAGTTTIELQPCS